MSQIMPTKIFELFSSFVNTENGILWCLIPFATNGYIVIVRILYMATRKDAKEELTATQREHQQAVNKALDETKDVINVTTREATREIPQYTRKLGDIQEQTIKTTREIADNYIESQKEIISIYQSVWTPFVENANSRFWYYMSISPKGLAETFGTVVSNFADNVIATTRLANNVVSANMYTSVTLQRTKDNLKEFSRLGINAARTFHEASNDVVTTVFSTAETVPSSRLTR